MLNSHCMHKINKRDFINSISYNTYIMRSYLHCDFQSCCFLWSSCTFLKSSWMTLNQNRMENMVGKWPYALSSFLAPFFRITQARRVIMFSLSFTYHAYYVFLELLDFFPWNITVVVPPLEVTWDFQRFHH